MASSGPTTSVVGMTPRVWPSGPLSDVIAVQASSRLTSESGLVVARFEYVPPAPLGWSVSKKN